MMKQLLIKETGKEAGLDHAPFIFGANIYCDAEFADENRPDLLKSKSGRFFSLAIPVKTNKSAQKFNHSVEIGLC